ncbi:MAG: ATP-dependent Clp protease proteolytic subunit, partial [Candidatus Dormibacteria bacterium]
DRDFFMSPEEALEYGLIDHILSNQRVTPVVAANGAPKAAEAESEAAPAAR